MQAWIQFDRKRLESTRAWQADAVLVMRPEAGSATDGPSSLASLKLGWLQDLWGYYSIVEPIL